MNREDRRRYAKQVAKGEISVGAPKSQLIATAIVYRDKRYTDPREYADAVERYTANDMSTVCSKLLYDTEIYIAAANMLIMLTAMEMAIGDLKTVQKSYQKIIDCYNEAAEYVDTVGIRNAYEGFRKDYGIELDFDDCDLDWLWDEGEKILERFKLRVGR